MITCDPRIRSGWPCIAGTRLGVELVAGDIAAGETVEQYALDKGVTVEQIREALAVYEGMRPLFEAFSDRPASCAPAAHSGPPSPPPASAPWTPPRP